MLLTSQRFYKQIQRIKTAQASNQHFVQLQSKQSAEIIAKMLHKRIRVIYY